MKKIVGLVAALLVVGLFSGCATLETGWKIGVVAGDKLLPEETKSKVKPYKEAVEDGYAIYKDSKEGKQIVQQDLEKTD